MMKNEKKLKCECSRQRMKNGGIQHPRKGNFLGVILFFSISML